MIIIYILAGGVLCAGLVVLVLLLMFFPLWLQAKATGVPVSLADMCLMRLRAVDPALIIKCLIPMVKAGVTVTREELETHVLAGGNLPRVSEALIAAHQAGLEVDFRKVAAIDLAGRNVAAAVSNRVTPKVLVCPPAGSGLKAISGVCQDGIRLGVRARVTVRTNINRLVGGAGEETVIARVGEGIVASIGRATTHKEVLQRPEMISEYLLQRGLDSGTCFEILSIDIADVDVLDNLGARLRSVQAETDKQIAQAQAEIRRATAVAARQEMQAKTLEMFSAVVAAQEQLPLATASAFRESNLGQNRPWRAAMLARIKGFRTAAGVE